MCKRRAVVPLTLTLSPWERGLVAVVGQASLLPTASACGCGIVRLRTRLGEFAREKDRMRGVTSVQFSALNKL